MDEINDLDRLENFLREKMQKGKSSKKKEAYASVLGYVKALKECQHGN